MSAGRQGQSILDVRADAHLLGRAQEHGDPAVAARGEELGLGFVGRGLVDEPHAIARQAAGDEQ